MNCERKCKLDTIMCPIDKPNNGYTGTRQIIEKLPSRPSGRFRSEHQAWLCCFIRLGHGPLRRTWVPKQGTQLFLKYCDRTFNSSSLNRPEICRDPYVAGSSSATGALPDEEPESLRSPCGLAIIHKSNQNSSLASHYSFSL
ncbi:hypothetical protein PoB_005468800 [Plakobranchus ocellatus]|uniref:Uncharacterized protein n=1 Tax=Plakobranchus ocellatus TaxID=259542 RepID=A0AAV4CB07_9GAST|nr:hypothetical protein PoB_005468800 [Plakobranchus ocellatus]